MTTLHTFHGAIVEPFDDLFVDVVLLTMARHHAACDDEIRAIIDYVSCDTVNRRQFDMFLTHIGHRRRFLADAIEVNVHKARRTIVATLAFSAHGMRWRAGLLSMDGGPPPSIITTALTGRPLRDLVEHPYLPPHACIGSMTARGDGWTASLAGTPLPLRA